MFNVYGTLDLVDGLVVVTTLIISPKLRKLPNLRLLATGYDTYDEALLAAGKPEDWVLDQSRVSVTKLTPAPLKPSPDERRYARRNDRHTAKAELRNYRS